MVSANHSQMERLGKHEYKCSQITSLRILLWLMLTIARENLHVIMNINVHRLLPKEIG